MSAIPETARQGAWRRLISRPGSLVSIVFLTVLILLCVLGPLVWPYTESMQELERAASPPSWQHWLGTDSLGRDLAVRVLKGGQMSLLVGCVATLVAVVIGVSYGLVSGLASQRVDAAMMRFVDILYAFPFMVFVILLTVMFGRSLWLLFAAIGAVEWLTMARVIRGQVLALKKLEFITAARASGATTGQILLRHLLPNVAGVIVIYASLTVPGVMLLEATLSFLGLGVQPPNASWGVLISEGAAAMQATPWLLIGPAALFSATLIAMNTLSDALRDALDPKSMTE